MVNPLDEADPLCRLPLGIQIVGPRGADDRVLAAAAAFERLFA